MPSFHFPNSKITAAIIHLLISAGLLVTLISIVAFIWYPGALVFAGGAEQGLKIVIAVDMILGPLLTLVVYNIKKVRKELIRDLTIIAIFQFSCLFAGMSLVYEQRPLAVVYSGDTFYILDKMQLNQHNIAVSTLVDIPGDYPKLILEKPPLTEDENVQYTISKLPYFPLSFRTDLWISFPEDIDTLNDTLKVNDASTCITVKLMSYGQLGSACFMANTRSFSHYQ